MNTSGNFSQSIFIAVLFSLVVLLIARRALPAQDARGESFQQDYYNSAQSTHSSTTLIVASYNIQTGKSNEGVRDIQRSAQALAGVDIAGVQEVYAPNWLNVFGIGTSQIDALAKSGSFLYSLNPTVKRWFKDHRGNAILSKLPVDGWHTTMLPDWSRKSYRNFTVATMLWNDQPITFINTHLHTSKGQDQQLELVIQEFDKHSRVILTGDFNTRSDSTRLKSLIERSDVVDTIGQLGLDPHESERIDWIITRGFKAINGRYAPRGISDHPYYEVELALQEN